MPKKIKTKLKKLRKGVRESLDFGAVSQEKQRLLVLVLAFVFLQYVFVLPEILGFDWNKKATEQPQIVVPVKSQAQIEFEKDAKQMVDGYPIEQMLPYIVDKDKRVAAFMLAIAKKESNWGKRVPVSGGEDCYNYWGFRLKTEKLGSGGHSCFETPQEAVQVVASRIEELVETQSRETAREMVVWKCGYSCAGHNPESVSKWIKDVDYYNRLLLN